MADIVKAMKKEKEYISYRINGEEPFHLVDAIKECGFTSLNEYCDEKYNYNFRQMHFEFIETYTDRCLQDVQWVMDNQIISVLFAESDKTFVFSGSTKDFNEEFCIENNIPVFPINTGGGAIVSTPGDLSIGICMPENMWKDATYILNNIKDIMSNYMDNVEVAGNDILVDSKKVCGSTQYNKNGMICFVAHISFNDNTDLIENICKPVQATYSFRRQVVKKAPSCITGMTTDEFKQGVFEWLQVQFS